MTADIESQIESCLAYHVLRDANKWIGVPRPSYLESFLAGASTRAIQTDPDFSYWRVHGVLEYPDFYSRLVASTGHPTLTIRWATALEMTHFSFAEGCSYLLEDALAWHREHGIKEDSPSRSWSSSTAPIEEFWDHFAARPAMYMGSNSGWGLYCFLRGLTDGGDWLGLPEVSLNSEVFDLIAKRSTDAYGSKFAAFRVYDASPLLGWAGYPRPDANTQTGDNKTLDTKT
ncbi:MAG: hypothetical protein MI807_21040 [Verrucomicrobiales bacterium]|nr:hypothetical protein [Verrucomicrobiales bacterium]